MVAQIDEQAMAGSGKLDRIGGPGARLVRAMVAAVAMTAVGCTTGGPAKVPKPPQPPPPTQPVKAIDVTAAALPFAILRGRGGHEITPELFLTELGQARAVCIGEGHTEVHDHWAQLYILDLLSARNRAAGVATGLGFEMFQRPLQGVVDDYQAGRIDEATMLARTAWKKRWGYDYAFYRPMVDLAIERGVVLLALNAAKELIKKVTKQGVAGLAPVDRDQLPADLELDDTEHRAWFRGIMEEMGGAAGHSGGMGGGKPPAAEQTPAETAAAAEAAAARAERIYNSQVVWDETMADTAAGWVKGGEQRQVIVLAGSGHCHDSAIVRRIQRRGVTPVVSVKPIVDDGEGNVADLLAQPVNDYLFVMTPPPSAEKPAEPPADPS